MEKSARKLSRKGYKFGFVILIC